MKQLLFFWCCVICFGATISAQVSPDMQFTHITTADGLSTQYVRNIFQDSRGLIWICTTAGLNRYDGNSFKIYKNNPGNPNSLPGDDIWSIAEDKKGNFWVGTQTGLCYFEPGSNSFTNYLYQPGNSNTLAYTRAENLLVDDSNYLWVGSLNGLQRFDPVSKKFRLLQFATKEALIKNVNTQAVYYLYIDKKKQLWTVAGGNLYLINRQNFSFQKIIERDTGNLGVNSIYQDHDGQYWLCYWGKGFARFDGRNPPAEKDFADHTGIYLGMTEWRDRNNKWWLVLTKDAVCFYDKANGNIIECKHDNDKPNSLMAYGTKNIITDKDNNLWITTNKGIELVEPGRQFFRYHWLSEKQDREDFYHFGIPMPVYKDGSNYWTALWHGKGLIKLDSTWKTIKRYPTIPPGSTHPNDKTIFAIYKDAANDIWLSMDKRIVKFNEAKNTFNFFIPSDIHPDLFEFRKILPCGNDRLIVCTRHNGLYIFNKKTEQFENHISADNKNGLPGNDIRSAVFDKKGNLWISTFAGICKLDGSSFTIIETYKHEEGKINSLPDNTCGTIDVDSKNNIWIGTQRGLSKLDTEKKIFTNFTTANGLCNNSVGKLLADKNDNIWMNTENGLSLFRQKENKFQNFYKEDGLPQNSLDGIINKDENGIIYLGDAGVILKVNPDEIPFNAHTPAVLVTDAAIGNEHYSIQTNNRKEKFIKTAYGFSSLTINFAVLNYNAPNLNRYYYTLEGSNNYWNESNKGVATYLNLAPGHYKLKVKGSNNSGIMNEEGDFINIIITPLWYQTILFKVSCGLVLSALVFLFLRGRILSVKKQAGLNQKIAETKMQALRSQMNPHFIFNSLNSIENFILLNDKRMASDYLNKFSNLIRSILDSSRTELVPLLKDMETLDLYADLEQLRFNNKFEYKTYIDPELTGGDFRVPPLLIQPFIENAIVHGLAHSERDNLFLTVTVTLENNKIKYTIQDNGIGRVQANKYNLQNKPQHESVGLKITEERVLVFNNSDEVNKDIIITDLYDENKNPTGTKVELTIKVM